MLAIGPSRLVRTTAAAALGALLMVAAALLTTVPAAAHDVLVGSTPADGSTLDRPPPRVVLEFSGPVQERFAQVSVLDDTGGDVAVTPPVVTGRTAAVDVPDLAPGAYAVAFRVVSADGHPISGRLRFTVAAAEAAPAPTAPPAGTAPPAPSPTAESSAPTPPAQQGAGTRTPLIAGAAALATVATLVALMLAGRRRPGGDGTGGGTDTGPR